MLFPLSKILAECQQTDSKFDQKMSADWYQLRFHSIDKICSQ